MALVIPPGFALVAYRFLLDGDPEEMVTTLGMEMDSFAGGQDAADQLRDNFLTGFTAADILADYTFVGTRVLVGQDGGPPVVFEALANVEGEATAGNALPQNVAFLVTKRTASGGRSGRGRMYFPPFAAIESEVSSRGVLSPAAVSAVQSRIDAGLPLTGAVILHDSSSPTTVPTPITSLTLQALVATQRRRLRR